CAADSDVLRRLPGAWDSDRYQRGRRHALSDFAARQRLRLATRARPHRLDRRPPSRRAVRRHARAAALPVVGVAAFGRRRRLLRHPCAEYGAPQGAPGIGKGAVAPAVFSERNGRGNLHPLIRPYTAGMTIKVRMVDDTMPPIIGTAIRCMTSAPVPVLHMIG